MIGMSYSGRGEAEQEMEEKELRKLNAEERGKGEDEMSVLVGQTKARTMQNDIVEMQMTELCGAEE